LSINLTNRTWHCTSLQNGTVVTVTVDDGNSPLDAVPLDAGCTGRLVVHVHTSSADGVKVHMGAHDLVVTGDVTCDAKYGRKHQDGVQAMGGGPVQFGDGIHASSFKVSCPTGNNGGLYIKGGAGGQSTPTGIVCDHCELFEGNAAVVVGADSIRSGVRNSILHQGTSPASPKDCTRFDPAARQAVDDNNVCTA
jgi:hypothetical protein